VWKAGRRKLAVLPLPVLAMPTKSRPPNTMGHAMLWMQVGVVYPAFSMVCMMVGPKGASLNVK